MWEATARYGLPYFSNFINSDMNPEDARSSCAAAMRIDNRLLQKARRRAVRLQPLTGSIGVVTRSTWRDIGYTQKNRADFFRRLDELLAWQRKA